MSEAHVPNKIDRWRASLTLGFEARDSRTILARRQRLGPLVVQRPFYPEGERCHVYLLHPPGGIVGGDELAITVHADTHSKSLITTPGASKFYRSAGAMAHLHQTLNVAPGAHLEWLPQESIYFPGCNASIKTDVLLSGDGAVTLWDVHCFGRPANNESFDYGNIDIQLSLYRDNQPLLLERQRVDAHRRHYRSLLGGHAVSAVLVSTQANDNLLERCREQYYAATSVSENTTSHGSASLALTLIDDVLIARYLGDSTEIARRLLTDVWLTLRKTHTGEQAALPRIWLT